MSDIREIIRARLRDFDPTLDLSSGSPADALVVSPIAELLSSDALTTDSRDFIYTKLKEAFPDISFGEGDALTDILVNASSVLLEPYRAELSRIESAQSLARVSELADDDVDALAANWLVTRVTGAFARVTVIATLTNARSLTINGSVRFLTRSGLVFNPTSTYTLSATQVATFNQVASGAFEVPVQCIALERGAEYNVAVGDIIAVENLDAVTSVTNRVAGYGGIDREDNEALVTRISQVVSERSLTTERGIRAKILNEESDIDDVTVIGFGDEEMIRDRVTSERVTAVKGSGFAVPFYSFAVVCLYSGAPEVGDELRITSLVDGTSQTAEITKVSSVGQVGDILSSTQAYLVSVDIREYATSLRACTVSSPVDVSLSGSAVSPEVSIGGKVDVYVTPNNDGEATSELNVSPHGGLEGVGVIVSSVAEGHKSVITLLMGDSQLSVDPSLFNDRIYSHILIESGSLRGAYRVLSTVADAEDNKFGLVVDYAFDALYTNLNLRWRAVNRVDLPLNTPARLIEPYASNEFSVLVLPDRKSFRANRLVSTHVLAGDRLVISSIDADLIIERVEGDTLFTQTGVSTQGQLSAEVYRDSQSLNRVVPFVNSVTINDTALPYGKSLGAEILSASEPITLNDGGLARVTPNMVELFRQDASRILSVDMSTENYSVLVGGTSDPSHRRWSNPSDASSTGIFLVRVVWDLANNGGDDADAFEFALPTGLLVPNSYTTLTCYGDLDVDALLSEVQSLYQSGGSLSDLTSTHTYTRQPPITGGEDDLISAYGESHLIKEVHNIHIDVDNYTDTVDASGATLRSVPRSRAINISLVTTKSELTPSATASVDSSMQFSVDPTGSLPAIDMLEFLQLLCRPEQLVQQGYITNTVVTRLNNNSLPASATPAPISSGAIDESVVSCLRPSRGSMALYYIGPRSVRISSPRVPDLSHSAAMALVEGTEIKLSSNSHLDADGLHIPKEFIQRQISQLTWSRDADLKVDVALAGSRISSANSYLDEESNHTYGSDCIVITGTPAHEIADPSKETRVSMLRESLTVSSRPPRIDVYRLYAKEGDGGTSAQQLLATDAYIPWLLNESSGEAIDASIVDELFNPEGNTINQVLNALDPSLLLVNDVNADLETRTFIFYHLVEINDGCGLPTFETDSGSTELKITPLYTAHVPQAPINLRGDYIWVDHSSTEVEQGVIVAAESGSVFLDKPVNKTTSDASVYGWCFIDPNELGVIVIEGPRVLFLNDNNEAELTDIMIDDNASGLYCGGTSNFIAQTLTGRSIDLINSAWDPRVDLAAFTDGLLPLPENYPDDPSIYAGHLGNFTIDSIEDLQAYDITSQSDVTYRQRIKLSSEVDLSILGQLLDVYPDRAVTTFFRVADDAIPVEQDVLKTCVGAQVYHREPTDFKVASIPMDYGFVEQHIELSTLDDGYAGKADIGVFRSDNYGEYTVPVRDLRRTPYKFYTPLEAILTTEPYYGGIEKLEVDYVSSLPTKPDILATRSVLNAGEDSGYFEIAGTNVYSDREQPTLSVPAHIYTDSAKLDALRDAELSITYETSPSITVIGNRYNSPDHRSVCADIMLRRTLPCYVGIYLRYEGGSDEDVVVSDVKTLIRNSILRGADFSADDVIAAARRRGARTVTESAIYLVLSDATRSRRIFFMRGRLSTTLVGNYTGTRRTVGVRLSDFEKMGVNIDIQRT